MEGLRNYLLNEINNSSNNVHNNQLIGFLDEMNKFIEEAFEEVGELLIEEGLVVPMEEYEKVVNQLNQLTANLEE